jgi:hypothetical protein
VIDRRAICETCGHTRDWHDRDVTRARLGSDPSVERPCYREVGDAPCRCGGFRESGMVAVPSGSGAMRNPTASGLELVRVAALVLLLIVLGLGLLYAYRSQAPSQPEVNVSQAVQDINAGRVRAITIVANKATLEFTDSPAHKEQTTLPEPDGVLMPAVSGYNATHPSQPIELRYVQDSQAFGVLGSILLSLLPVLLIGGFFYYTMRARSAP